MAGADDQTVTIAGRFCGPPESGNGGYASGVVAGALVGAAAVEVTLRRPPPLDRPLRLRRDDGTATLTDGDDVVATASVATTDPADGAPTAPTPDEVAAAVAAFDLDGYAADHPFVRCFTCGPAREDGDGLRLFPAATGRDSLVVWPWALAPTMVGDDGAMALPIVWASLDCPSGLAWIAEEATPAVLGRMTAAVRRRPEAGEPLVSGGWRAGGDGRKLRAGSALWSADGELLAAAATTWVVLTPEQQAAFGAPVR